MFQISRTHLLKIILYFFILSLSACRIEPMIFENDGRDAFSLQDFHALTTDAFGKRQNEDSEYFLIVLTRSVNMNFDDPNPFYASITARTEGSVGHAWILLGNGTHYIECGHTGEFGEVKLRYHEGIKKAIKDKKKNPISYLWEDMKDGKYEEYYMNEKPTCAARFELTEQEYNKIYEYINTYDYKSFSITKSCCTFFAVNACALVGIQLGHLAKINIPKYYIVNGNKYNLWEDNKYSVVSVGTPDVLEKSLKIAIKNGLGKDVTDWYYK
jgi:hypothetical protein